MDQEPEPEPQPHTGSFEDANGTGEAALACNCCRRRKLRCSREVPTCQQCRKTGSRCVYETKRAKPGMKAGAIDNLHRRLDALEKEVQQKSIQGDQSDSHTVASSLGDHEGNPYGILSFFAKEFQRFNDAQAGRFASQKPALNGSQNAPPAKRRRLDDIVPNPSELDHGGCPLPEQDELELVLQAYFAYVHPWIPILHEGRLRRRLADGGDNENLQVVIQAMVLVAAKYIQSEAAAMDLAQSENEAQRSRDSIVATAMRQLSVENLQALSIVAFNDVGSGLGAQAWSIVGALSRSVEYLQLAVENDETDRPSLSQPQVSLSPPQDWTEAEERRRVFWNAFNLDRLCSVTMGWNTSLTSDDVNRRLPCDGIKWRKEDQVTTPYFGIWDKAAGRIGNPIAFLPSHYAQPQQAADEDAQTPSEAGTSPGASSAPVDMSTVGAFAYSIEATESLSRVTSYFLQQKVSMRDQKDLSSWLTRFKELDLRLVHWKMLLPQKWKVDMSRQTSRMDPNLTLAHITHNASMILLHQLIAFPLPEWPFKNRLPSLCSADTCQSAAVEIATISENYLKNAPPFAPVSSQFAFCLYVASRALLLQWQYDAQESSLAPQFWSLIESLDIMGKRWAGPHALDAVSPQANLAAKYSRKLREIYRACSRDRRFKIAVLGYTGEVNQSTSEMPTLRGDEDESDPMSPGAQPAGHGYSAGNSDRAQTMRTQTISAGNLNGNLSSGQSGFQERRMPVNMTGASGELLMQPVMGQNPLDPIAQPNPYQRGSAASGELGAISQLLLDPQFVDMDRIISYDDGMFGSEYEGGSW